MPTWDVFYCTPSSAVVWIEPSVTLWYGSRKNIQRAVSLGMYGVTDFLFVYSQRCQLGVFGALSSQEVRAAERSNVYIGGEWYPADWRNVGLSSNSHCEDGCWDSIQMEMFSSWNRHLPELWFKMCSHAGNRCGKCGVNSKAAIDLFWEMMHFLPVYVQDFPKCDCFEDSL